MPIWFIYSLTGSVCAALGMFVHQRLGGTNYASAVWFKILAVFVAAPVLMQTGLPDNPMFYLMTAAAAALWCINDLIYFEAVRNHGAALIARLSPLGLILSFVVWFCVKPDLLTRYLEDPLRFTGICVALLIAVVSGVALRRCPFSWQALKNIWFVVFGGALGMLLVKTAVDYAPQNQAVFSYVGFEAGLMLIIYSIYFTVFRREAFGEIFSNKGLRTGGYTACFLVVSVICRVYAQKNVEIPALASMVGMLDAVWLMAITYFLGMKDESNKVAGLGIVAAALLLVLLKIR